MKQCKHKDVIDVDGNDTVYCIKCSKEFEINELISALQFYADKKNKWTVLYGFKEYHEETSHHGDEFKMDHGNIARKALKGVK